MSWRGVLTVFCVFGLLAITWNWMQADDIPAFDSSEYAAGATAVGTNILNDLNDTRNVVNGNLDTDNLKSNAGILGTQLDHHTIAALQITNNTFDSTYTDSVFADSAWTHSVCDQKLSGEPIQGKHIETNTLTAATTARVFAASAWDSTRVNGAFTAGSIGPRELNFPPIKIHNDTTNVGRKIAWGCFVDTVTVGADSALTTNFLFSTAITGNPKFAWDPLVTLTTRYNLPAGQNAPALVAVQDSITSLTRCYIRVHNVGNLWVNALPVQVNWVAHERHAGE